MLRLHWLREAFFVPRSARSTGSRSCLLKKREVAWRTAMARAAHTSQNFSCPGAMMALARPDYPRDVRMLGHVGTMSRNKCASRRLGLSRFNSHLPIYTPDSSMIQVLHLTKLTLQYTAEMVHSRRTQRLKIGLNPGNKLAVPKADFRWLAAPSRTLNGRERCQGRQAAISPELFVSRFCGADGKRLGFSGLS